MSVRRSVMACGFVAMVGLAVSAVPAGAARGAPGPNENAAPQATLVRTDIFLPGGPERDNGRKPPGPGPVPTANCTNDGSTSSTYATTGFTSNIVDRTARLNTSTVPALLGATDRDRQRETRRSDAWSTEGAPAFTVQAVTSETGGVVKQTANRHTDVLFGRTSGNALGGDVHVALEHRRIRE